MSMFDWMTADEEAAEAVIAAVAATNGCNFRMSCELLTPPEPSTDPATPACLIEWWIDLVGGGTQQGFGDLREPERSIAIRHVIHVQRGSGARTRARALRHVLAGAYEASSLNVTDAPRPFRAPHRFQEFNPWGLTVPVTPPLP